ncbi:hypothetical protein [Sphingomonas sp. KR3-1]|uniref:hypothetical protein n=1 Tax=Sphingomonas sp. KR3-1 TaxID=3156611 RepID=UPI0032B56B66
MSFSATPSSEIPALGFHKAALPDGWTASWPDLVSWMLIEAERRFGPRDPRWFFAGVEFADGVNHVTYPLADRPFHVAIRLTRAAAADPRLAHFELAHEIVHLLSPSANPSASNCLLEGMAGVFQLEMASMAELGVGVGPGPYLDAIQAVLALIGIDPGAVRKIRAACPDLAALTPDALLAIVPALSKARAEQLCAPFPGGH